MVNYAGLRQGHLLEVAGRGLCPAVDAIVDDEDVCVVLGAPLSSRHKLNRSRLKRAEI